MGIDKPSNENKPFDERIKESVGLANTMEGRMRELLDLNVRIHGIQDWIDAMLSGAVPSENEALKTDYEAAHEIEVELAALQGLLEEAEDALEKARLQPESATLFGTARAAGYRLTQQFESARRSAQRE